MTDYGAKLAALNASISTRTARARALLSDHGQLFERYRGGLPAAWLATIMEMESGGKFGAAGDVSLGEVGWYQITAEFPTTVGVDPEVRRTEEGNVFLGALEYQIAAARWAARGVSTLRDRWMLARLSFAIGDHGAHDIMTRALDSLAEREAPTWARLVAWVDETGGHAEGSQSAAKVRYRVHAVEVNRAVAESLTDGDSYGHPEIIGAPRGVRYTFPTSLRKYATATPRGQLATLFALGFVGLLMVI